MQVEEFLERSAKQSPDKTALIVGDKRLTYREVDEQANRLANALIAQGLERGDRVAICLDNGVEAVIAIFAALKAGGVFLPINPTTKTDKIAYILNNCRATALISEARKIATIPECWGETPHLKRVFVFGQGEMPKGNDKTWIEADPIVQKGNVSDAMPEKRNIDIDLAGLIYTSGSTGKPKGVMVTHLNIVSAATSITTYLENTADDIILSALPLSFDYGLYQVLMAFKIGGTIILEKSFTYTYAVIDKLIKEKATGFPIVPTMVAILLQMDLKKYDFSHLRYMTNTAAALPAEHIKSLRELFPKMTIYSMYGLTECKRVSYLPPSQIDIRPTSIGKGMPNEEVYLVDSDGKRLPNNSTGELVVRGANVMKGYWELPEETAKCLKPGPLPNEMVLYSGDLFRSDEEGYLYFVGRKDDIIKTRGEKVSPKEVEEALYAIPGVAEAAVIGVPDPILGQSIHAFVVLKDGVTMSDKEVLHHCKQRLEDFMVPKHVEVRKEKLPKSANGKIDKKVLAAKETKS